MRALKWLLDKTGGVLVGVVLSPIILGFLSWIRTGNWAEWYSNNINLFWGAIAAGLLVGLGVQLFIIRLRQVRDSAGGPYLTRTINPRGGWVPIGELKHAEVLWRIVGPGPTRISAAMSGYTIVASELEVDIPPRCPLCGTELEEAKRFWGGYSWKCIGCNFLARNKDSFIVESERAEKLARRQWEIHGRLDTSHLVAPKRQHDQ